MPSIIGVNEHEELKKEMQNTEGLFINMPAKSYRCSKGHAWKGSKECMTIIFSYNEELRESKAFCMRCLEEVLARETGIVTEVPNGT